MKAIRIALVMVAAMTATASFADPVPGAIKSRYWELSTVLNKLDFKAFGAYFSSDFVNVDPKGTQIDRAEFMASVKPMFEGNKKGVAHAKLISATKTGDVVAVKFDLRFDLIGSAGTTKMHEVGTDYWKKVDGKWVMVKTVDKTFTVVPPKGK